MRSIAIVAAHFVPSNLTAVHRSRLWTYHLRDFGWYPIIVTTDPAYYEEAHAQGLLDLVPDGLEVIRTRAIPTEPVRVIGDIGIRAFYWHYRALCKLAEDGRIDFLHITIPSFYSALLGRLIHNKYGTPYGIDYIDPWVHDFPVPEVKLGRLKSWASTQLSEIMEPWAVRDASLITGVAESYYEGVLERNPHLRTQAVTAAMPYGGSEKDHAVLREKPRSTFLWPPDSDSSSFRLLYAGAMLPKAYPLLERLFEGLNLLREEHPDLYGEFELYFVGTGSSPDDDEDYNIKPVAEKYGVEDVVYEHPARVSYLDVLSHLQAAEGALIIGSTERHYTPSKTYQAVLSRTPIWAMLHEESSATEVIRKSNVGEVVSFPDGALPSSEEVATSLQRFIENGGYDPDNVRWDMYEQYSAHETTRVLAEALDAAYEGG